MVDIGNLGFCHYKLWKICGIPNWVFSIPYSVKATFKNDKISHDILKYALAESLNKYFFSHNPLALAALAGVSPFTRPQQMLLILADSPVLIVAEVTWRKHTLAHTFTLYLSPPLARCRWLRPWSRVGSMVLAICASDEHSTGERLSVPAQAAAGQRGSGRASQRGTNLRFLSRGTRARQRRKTHYPHSGSGHGEPGRRLTNFMDSFPTDKCRDLADIDTEPSSQGLRAFFVTRAESALNGTGSRVKGVFLWKVQAWH